MRLAVGDRVQPDKALGTIEKIRTSKEGYLVAEVLWDTGARMPEPSLPSGNGPGVQSAPALGSLSLSSKAERPEPSFNA